MSSSPVSDVEPVAPVNLLPETTWFVTPSSQLLPAPAEVEYRGVDVSPELGSDMLTTMSRFLPLRPPVSPVSLDGVDLVVSEDFDFGTMDVFPVFTVSPETDGYFPRISPVSSPGSPVAQTAGSVLDEATGSFHSTLGSPAASLSKTHHAANLRLLSEPLIPLPDAVFLQADPTLLLDLTPSYDDCITTQVPVASVSPPSAFLSREGPFDASTKLAAINNHPLIFAGLTGCPYHMMTYHEADLASVDTSFGVQIHHPRFLECVGAPESARLLGRPPAEWLSVMDRRDALWAALQLQRDAVLMTANVVALQRMSSEVLHTVFCQELFPSGAVEEAAPVPRVLRASTQWHPYVA